MHRFRAVKLTEKRKKKTRSANGQRGRKLRRARQGHRSPNRYHSAATLQLCFTQITPAEEAVLLVIF